MTPDSELVDFVPDLWNIGDRPFKTDDVSKTKPKRAKRSGKKG